MKISSIISFYRCTSSYKLEGYSYLTYSVISTLSKIAVHSDINTIIFKYKTCSDNIEFLEKIFLSKIKEYNFSYIPIKNLLKQNLFKNIATTIAELLTSTYFIVRYKRIGTRIDDPVREYNYKDELIIFLGNASKMLTLLDIIYKKIFYKNIKFIYYIFNRYEIFYLLYKLDKIISQRQMIYLTPSIELYLIANKYMKISNVASQILYPPIDISYYRPNKKLRDEILSLLGTENLILYIGRLNKYRFPLKKFKEILRGLLAATDAKLLIVANPDEDYYSWLSEATKIIFRYSRNNKKVIFINDIISPELKLRLFNAAKVFIYPASYHGAAVEPPISVLEAISTGATLITTGKSSTYEIALLTKGYILNNFELINKILDNVTNVNYYARNWALHNLSFDVFKQRMALCLGLK